MTETRLVEGYQNFEDCDEREFVGPNPTGEAVGSAHDITHIVTDSRDATPLEERVILLSRGQRWVIRQLDELLRQGLTRERIGVFQEMRLAQARDVKRCEALIAELAREHHSRPHKNGGTLV